MDTFSRYQHSRTARTTFKAYRFSESSETIRASPFFRAARTNSGYPVLPGGPKRFELPKFFKPLETNSSYPDFSGRPNFPARLENRVPAWCEFQAVRIFKHPNSPTIHTSKNVNYLIVQWCIYYLRLHIMTLCTYLLSKCSSLSSSECVNCNSVSYRIATEISRHLWM